MKHDFPFEINSQFLEDTLKDLEEQTDYSREELIRGITYMIGRRTGQILQKISEDKDQDLLHELKIAVLHSSEEK